jgi:hypothetical protein
VLPEGIAQYEPVHAEPPSAPTYAATDTATNEVDVRNLFEEGPAPAVYTPPVAPEPAPAPAPTPAPAPAMQAEPPSAPAESLSTSQPIDLLANDGVDADVLDDDAFFATLRDAVHDDAPLGPREDEDRFFDQDADGRGTFRDVFRRRR